MNDNSPKPSSKGDAGPDTSVRPLIDRRAFILAASAAVLGACAVAWRKWPAQTAPLSNSQPATFPTSQPGSRPASQSDSQPATQATTQLGSPDLGSEVFPDPAGNAIARALDAPVIVVPRSSWTDRKPDLSHMLAMGIIDKITVHHTAWAANDQDAWKKTVIEIDRIGDFHTSSRGWADIAYHFVIDHAGRVWQARPLAYQGAHVKGHNEHNLGIVLMGDFDKQRPTSAQLTTLTLFIPFLQSLYHLNPKAVFTHGELGQTHCPGKFLQAFMERWRTKQ